MIGHAMEGVVAKAEEIAVRAHAGQVDKAGAPYIDHPRRVVAHVRSTGGRDDAIAAAWLHDVLEDTALGSDDLRAAGIPARVVTAVEALTHRPGEPRDDYYARVRSNELALIVKRADLADNTDPVRVGRLDPATRERLAAKYAHARQALGL